MAKYLISFPSGVMDARPDEMEAVGNAARAVIVAAKAAGVYVFGGGIDEDVTPVLVAADGSVTEGTHPGSRLTGGFTVLDLPDRAAAVRWARDIAIACRCAQELRVFMFDPVS